MRDLHEGILLEFAAYAPLARTYDEDIKEGRLRGMAPRDYAGENETKKAQRARRKRAGLCVLCEDPAAINTGTRNHGKLGTRCGVHAAARRKKAA